MLSGIFQRRNEDCSSRLHESPFVQPTLWPGAQRHYCLHALLESLARTLQSAFSSLYHHQSLAHLCEECRNVCVRCHTDNACQVAIIVARRLDVFGECPEPGCDKAFGGLPCAFSRRGRVSGHLSPDRQNPNNRTNHTASNRFCCGRSCSGCA